MTIRMNGALRRCSAAAALGGLIAFACAPAATAQWLPPPWRVAPPVVIERSLEAQGYVLTGPLMPRPGGVYLADVSAGPAGYQRLVVDARSGEILERFAAPGRIWGPVLAARGEEFGAPPPPAIGAPPLSPGSPRPGPGPAARSAYGGPANVHIPAAISPYDSGEPPAGARPRPKPGSTGRKPSASRAAAINPPLPPPAPREAAKPTDAGAVAPAAPGSSPEGSEKPKVSVVPPALFE